MNAASSGGNESQNNECENDISKQQHVSDQGGMNGCCFGHGEYGGHVVAIDS